MKDRTNQVAVITGGAGGIGIASAEMWMKQNGKIVACDIDVEKGKAFEAKYPGKVVFQLCDTRKFDDLEKAVETAKKMGQFTCFFNNAGGGSPSDTLEDSYDNIEGLKNMVEININAYMQGTYIALRHFDPAVGGVVVNTCSMAGLLPIGAPPVYSMTKAANIHFTRAVASALGEESNMRCYALCPSYTATAMGPDPKMIKAAIGGILQAKHQAEGFMLLVEGDQPNGSVMRVTARRGGTKVVQDLVTYGREMGGNEKPRPGVVLKEATLEEYTGDMNTHLAAKDIAKL